VKHASVPRKCVNVMNLVANGVMCFTGERLWTRGNAGRMLARLWNGCADDRKFAELLVFRIFRWVVV
jgi:hypothetical protein